MKASKDSDGTSLLDSSMIVFGSAICDGDRHNHDHLPVILAGRGKGTLTPGRHIALAQETPMTNLYLFDARPPRCSCCSALVIARAGWRI